MQAFLNAATSGPSRRHMIEGFVSIDRPCSEYSGNTTRSMVERLRRALPTMATILSVWRARSSLVTTTGNCNCTSPITTPSGDLLRPPSPFMSRSFVYPPSNKQTRYCRTGKDYFSGGESVRSRLDGGGSAGRPRSKLRAWDMTGTLLRRCLRIPRLRFFPILAMLETDLRREESLSQVNRYRTDRGSANQKGRPDWLFSSH